MQKPLAFAPPVRVSVVGSHATSTAITSNNVVDVAAEMPAACFEHKDHLNHRYHLKRATWLATAAAGLAKLPAFADQQWQCFNHDPRYWPQQYCSTTLLRKIHGGLH